MAGDAVKMNPYHPTEYGMHATQQNLAGTFYKPRQMHGTTYARGRMGAPIVPDDMGEIENKLPSVHKTNNEMIDYALSNIDGPPAGGAPRQQKVPTLDKILGAGFKVVNIDKGKILDEFQNPRSQTKTKRTDNEAIKETDEDDNAEQSHDSREGSAGRVPLDGSKVYTQRKERLKANAPGKAGEWNGNAEALNNSSCLGTGAEERSSVDYRISVRIRKDNVDVECKKISEEIRQLIRQPNKSQSPVPNPEKMPGRTKHMTTHYASMTNYFGSQKNLMQAVQQQSQFPVQNQERGQVSGRSGTKRDEFSQSPPHALKKPDSRHDTKRSFYPKKLSNHNVMDTVMGNPYIHNPEMQQGKAFGNGNPLQTYMSPYQATNSIFYRAGRENAHSKGPPGMNSSSGRDIIS
jgi:hypothetical protein